MIEPEYLEEIKARYEAATEGPWTNRAEGFREDSEWGQIIHYGINGVAEISESMDSDPYHVHLETMSREDAEFIAYARTDVPALVAEVERLQELVEEKEAALRYEKYNARPPTPCEISEIRKKQVEKAVAERDRWKERWEATVQDATEQRATVQKVRELCGEWANALERGYEYVLIQPIIEKTEQALKESK